MMILAFILAYLVTGFIIMSLSVYLLNKYFPKDWLLQMQKEIFPFVVLTWPIQIIVWIFESVVSLCWRMSRKYTDWICKK